MTATLPFDLTAARALCESLMLDTCTITRDAESTDDDTLDEATGLLVRPTGDTTTIYTGACHVVPVRRPERTAAEGDAQRTTKYYLGSLPATAPAVKDGDIWTVTASLTDFQLVGMVFRVTDVGKRSINVKRNLRLEVRERP